MTKNHVEFLNYYFLMDVEFAIQRIVSTKSCDPPTIWDTRLKGSLAMPPMIVMSDTLCELLQLRDKKNI